MFFFRPAAASILGPNVPYPQDLQLHIVSPTPRVYFQAGTLEAMYRSLVRQTAPRARMMTVPLRRKS